MSKSKAQKSRNKAKTINKDKATSLNLLSWWREKSPVFRFLLSFFGVILLFYAFYYSSMYQNHLSGYVENIQARIASSLLNIFGYKTQVNGDIISGRGQSVSISKGCDGLEPIALFVGAILVFPMSFRFKWPGVLVGLAGLFLLNNLRIFGLYLAGIHVPKWFDVFHLHGGFVIFTVATIIIWFIWAGWALRKQKALAKETH